MRSRGRNRQRRESSRARGREGENPGTERRRESDTLYLVATVSTCTYHAAVPLAGYFCMCVSGWAIQPGGRCGVPCWLHRTFQGSRPACHATDSSSTSYSLAAAAAAAAATSQFRHVIVARALRVMRAAEKNRCRDQSPISSLVVG